MQVDGLLIAFEFKMMLTLQHSMEKVSSIEPLVPRAPNSNTFIKMLHNNPKKWPCLKLDLIWLVVAIRELEPDSSTDFPLNTCSSPTTRAPGESPQYRRLPKRASSNEMCQSLSADYWRFKFEFSIPWCSVRLWARPDPPCRELTPKWWVMLLVHYALEVSNSELESL
jgi:hypothetical protein